MEDTQLDEPETEETEQESPPVPLGTYAPFNVSDQKELTKDALDKMEDGRLKLAENIRAMVVAACQRESLGRRLEIEQAWRLQLMDRGFHRLIPLKRGGWSIAYQNTPQGIFGGMYEANLHDVNIIGVHNDIIVNALCRDIPKTEFTAKSDNDKAVTAAAAANKLKFFIQEDCCYKDAQAKVGRTFCTDDRAVAYMRPVADAQTYGFEDDAEDVVPETEETAPAGKPSKQPKIQVKLDIYGKLEHKCQIACDDDHQSPYQIIAYENDTATVRACFPWIADEIEGGSAGIAEIELDRVARASIKLAIQGGMVTGQGNVNDTTVLSCWLTPKMYWDPSCSEEARNWLLRNMPKGVLAVYAGTELAFARNEAWQEVLTVVHARTGKGQNRRALTEAYAGANMMLDNWVDLINKFFTATVPRVYYESHVFNVPQLRQSGNAVGRKEPFNGAMVQPNVQPILQDPMPTHQPTLPDFIRWFAGDLAELLTGAQLTLQGAPNAEGEQGTLGEAKMDNDAALTRLSEPWAAECRQFSNATRQAVEWLARVQPEATFDRIIGSEGRIRVEMKDIDAQVLALAETDTNFPESWSDREERIWQLVQQMPANQFIATVMSQPANARKIKDAARMGLTIPGAASWEKQEGEFTVLLSSQPQPNPKIQQLGQQIAKIKLEMESGAQDVQQRQATGGQVDPNEVQMLEQGLQVVQQLTQQMQQIQRTIPLVSSVPVRADGSEEDAIEEACCLEKMISPEGRRLATSTNQMERAGFNNLHLHWMEHRTAKLMLAKQNQQPVEPKVSASVQVDKLPPEWQAKLLAKMDVAVDPAQANEVGPHEISHEVEGVNASGAKEKVTTTLAGKSLN
jgi:hypothetical protein